MRFVWTSDGTTGEAIVVDGSGVKVRWEDDTIDLPTCCLKSKGYLERDALPESRRTTA